MPNPANYNPYVNRVDLSNMLQINTESLNKALSDIHINMNTLKQENEVLRARIAKLERPHG